MKLPTFTFEGNSINKNRIAMVWKGYRHVINFSIISNFHISMYPVYYYVLCLLLPLIYLD